MAVIRQEQETTVNFIPGEDTQIYSANPSHIRKLEGRIAEGKATLIRKTEDDIIVSVPVGKYDPIRGFKSERKSLTDEQKQALAERLQRARESKSSE